MEEQMKVYIYIYMYFNIKHTIDHSLKVNILPSLAKQFKLLYIEEVHKKLPKTFLFIPKVSYVCIMSIT